MKKLSIPILTAGLILFLGFNLAHAQKQMKTGEKQMSSIYDFTVNDIDGNPVKLEQYKGKTVLIVNVASKCGNTPQYEGLQDLYKKYGDKGLVILGFPANNFGGQEPGTNEEIKDFCTTNYGVTFPMFSKISVKGEDIHPLYKYLTSAETDPEFAGDITWNFNKFLINPSGKIVARFDSKDKPESEKVVKAIQLALK
jgi:glutathione peroxidase